MPKFEVGELAMVTSRSGNEFARIVSRNGRSYRVFTFGRRQLEVDARRLRKGKPAVLILESNLSPGRNALRTDRQRRSGVFLEEFFRALEFVVYREKVHTPESFEFFMKYALRDDVLVIHWSGHGQADDPRFGANRATVLWLSVEPMYLPPDKEGYLRSALETGKYRGEPITQRDQRWIKKQLRQYKYLRRTFSGMSGRIIFFSTCDIGKPKGLAEYVSSISRAKAVIAYEDSIDDHEANLTEAMVYSQLLLLETKRRSPGTIVANARDQLQQSLRRRIPLVCFVNGRRVA